MDESERQQVERLKSHAIRLGKYEMLQTACNMLGESPSRGELRAGLERAIRIEGTNIDTNNNASRFYAALYGRDFADFFKYGSFCFVPYSLMPQVERAIIHTTVLSNKGISVERFH